MLQFFIHVDVATTGNNRQLVAVIPKLGAASLFLNRAALNSAAEPFPEPKSFAQH
jgi:hypothetical protein